MISYELMIPVEARGNVLGASGSEDKMMKLSRMIHLLPALNGLYVNTNWTLLLVLSLWLAGVDIRNVERAVETFFEIAVYKLCTSQIEASTSPGAYPGHLTPFSAPLGGNLVILVFPGQGI